MLTPDERVRLASLLRANSDAKHLAATFADILLYLADRPTAYCNEIAFYLFDRYQIESRKKAKKVAAQRNRELQAHWRAKRLNWEPWQLVFIDESVCAPRTGDRKYGWALISLRCSDTIQLKRTTQYSILPAMTVDGYLDEPLIVQGAVTMEMFEE
ncbi:hypothetical protein Q7P35_005061 [Cladosporium inversicolor]